MAHVPASQNAQPGGRPPPPPILAFDSSLTFPSLIFTFFTFISYSTYNHTSFLAGLPLFHN